MDFRNQPGIVFATSAYVIWGLLPVYWKSLKEIPAHEILGHRIIWSLLFLAVILSLKKHWVWIPAKLHSRKTALVLVGTSLLLALNWLTYIWAVNSGFLVQASLGYFINPLVSVSLGVSILKEKLRSWQWVAVGLAGVGVVYLTLATGQFPWIALVLAFTFGFYGLFRKTAALTSLEGLSLEMGVLFLPAVILLSLLMLSGRSSWGQVDSTTNFLLLCAGVATASPMLLFTAGVRRIKLSTIGILQYISPSLQFLLGVFVYKEDFSASKLIGFVVIWTALFIYTLEGVMSMGKFRKDAAR
jgi:chloramphenicol-sensitive protein RarD